MSMQNKKLFANTDLIPKIKYVLGFVGGRFGDGKTLFLTNYAAAMWKNYKYVYANYHLKKIPNFKFLKKVNKETLFSLEQNSLLLLQESYHYFNNRECMKKENREIFKAIFQIRKKHLDIIADVPRLSYLDLRCLDNGTFFVFARGEVASGLYQYDIVENFNPRVHPPMFDRVNTFFVDMNPIYAYYDSFEMTKEDSGEEDDEDDYDVI